MSAEITTGPNVKDGSSDRLQMWESRWQEKKIGWHKNEVNNTLQRLGNHIVPHLGDGASCPSNDHPDYRGVRAFVPLCGKTLDMAYLATQPSVIEVVGVDGIQQALDEFAQENPEFKLAPSAPSGGGRFDRLVGDKISLIKGDFFDLDDEAIGGQCEAVWDRGSMVAISPDLRDKYADVIGKILSPGGKILLVALERREGDDEAVNAGPPFSLSERDVRNIYSSKDWVESVTLLQETDLFAKDPAEAEKYPGLVSFFELVILIKKLD